MSVTHDPGPTQRQTPAMPGEPRAFAPGGASAQSGTAPRRRRSSLLAFAVVGLCLVGAALYVYLPSLYEVETDDAYVDAHNVSIEPKVAAYVTALHVNDNSEVRAGDLLLELDPRDFQVAVDSAEAELESAHAAADNIAAQLVEQRATVAEQEAAIDGDRTTLTFAQEELQRYQSLQRTGIGSTERLQQAQSEIGERQAALQRDIAALDAATAHVAVLETQGHEARAAIDRQQAALAQAKLNLSYTKIYASVAGSIANKTVEVGNFVQPGQTLFAIVPDAIFVTANYKETQLADVRPGQPVSIRADAFPSLSLTGHVDSIQRGTGSQFALLPPENATGNFVKVVQRVPVKIVFDHPEEAVHWVSPGMSVETTIRFAKRPWQWP